MGFFWGACTGEWTLCLGVGVFYELFWLDSIPAGTFIPANSVLAMFLTLSLARRYNLVQPDELVLPLFLSVPCALLGSTLERFQRKLQDAGYNALLHWSRGSNRESPSDYPSKLIGRSLMQLFTVNFVVFSLTLFVLTGIISLFRLKDLLHAQHLPVNWGSLWFAGALGGVLSLRYKHSYVIVAGGVVMITLFWVL